MAADPVVRDSVAVADPNAPTHVLKPNADGSINVAGVSGNFQAAAVSTAAAPTYVEGSLDSLSQDLSGNLRVIIEGASGTTVTANQGTPGVGAWPVNAVNGGTFAVQNTAATPAGSALIGKVGIDQTTPGTTNAVQVLTGSTTAVTQATASSLNATVVGTGTFVTQSQPTKSATWTSSQVTVPATANGILLLASNASRQGATIYNAGTATVYVQQASTGVTTSNGFSIPAGCAFNISVPLYTGALYGIVATSTQPVTVVELT